MRAGRIGALLVLAALLLGGPVRAEGYFAGVDLSMGLAGGTSSTTNGGAAFAGGGTVYDLRFGQSFSVGGHVGYRFDPAFSVSLSYEHIRTAVSWNVDYPLVPGDSAFRGVAASNLLMGNAAYTHALTETTAIELRGGLGLAINTLSDVVESQIPTGTFLADLTQGTRFSPAAQRGIGLSQQLAPNVRLALGTSATYIGGFATGNTRTGNLGVTAITPYEIDHVWRANVGATLRIDF